MNQVKWNDPIDGMQKICNTKSNKKHIQAQQQKKIECRKRTLDIFGVARRNTDWRDKKGPV